MFEFDTAVRADFLNDLDSGVGKVVSLKDFEKELVLNGVKSFN